MIHQDLTVKQSSVHRKGLFAKKKIPKGTVVLAGSNIAVCYTKERYRKLSKGRKAFLIKWAYGDEDKLCLLWGVAKYINHSCDPNTATAGESDIAIRDIEAGEEVTYDYGLVWEPTWLNIKPMRCRCGSKNCRKLIGRLPKNSSAALRLARLAKNAARHMSMVEQPLLKKMNGEMP